MASEIEEWAWQVIEATEQGLHFEDSAVELKSIWPASTFEAARQLAAQANARHGEPLLWLIGVKQGVGVVGVEPRDLATWWPQVQSHFDKLSPRLIADRILNHKNGKQAVALMFGPGDPPYVIRYSQGDIPEKNAIRKEVPWREGTTVRSADRDDLLRVLEPSVTVPEIRVIQGLINGLGADKKPAEERLAWWVQARIFVTPKSSGPVVFTASQAAVAKVHLQERDIILRLWPDMQNGEGGLVQSAGTELVFRGPASVGMISLGGETEIFESQADEIGMTISWRAVGASRPSETEVRLKRSKAKPHTSWDRWEIVFDDSET